jgi:hypothetical protein
VKLIHPVEVIHVPREVSTCSACGWPLFAFIAAFFDDGEPVESQIYTGCVACDEMIEARVLGHVREWVHDGYRVVR